ncbi:response regulator [Alteromonas sediminis]|uniref:histidine kinase n=1 Tax=Alteromonas sediminis TaxID=2259342 RepID=A0A3N5ZAI9_9ALTE|nr:ATP-binding protein [Alteromonas sediminis]RPJ66488.1 response regulator [Alteromonas sediminis]
MKKLINIVLIFIIVGPYARPAGANLSLPFPNFPKIDNHPTGIVWSIKLIDDDLMIGAENGLFKMVGAYQKRIISCESMEAIASVTDILDIDNDIALVNSYSSGIYEFDKRKGCISGKLKLEIQDLHRTWDIGKNSNYLFLTTINNFYALDPISLEIMFDLQSLVGAFRQITITSMAYNENSVFLGVGKGGVLEINLKNFSLQTYTIEEYFDGASEILSVAATTTHWVAGSDSGLYISNVEPGFIKVPGSSEIGGVFEILAKDEEVFFIANGIYSLNLQKASIFEVKASNYLTDNIKSSSYTGLEVDRERNIYTSTGKTGLVFIPMRSGSLSYMFDLDSSFKKGNEVFFEAKNGNNSIYSLGSSDGQSYDLDNHNITQVKSLTGKKVSDGTITYDAVHKEIYKVVNGKNIPIFQGDILDYFKRRDADYFTVRGVGLFTISHDGAVKVLTENNLITNRHVNCLIEYMNTLILCSDGNGLLVVNKTTQELKRLNWFNPTFIRGAAELMTHSITVSTNNGLYLVNLKEETSAQLAQEFGVFDYDFEYNSVISHENTTIIFGDTLGYVFQNDYLSDLFSSGFLSHSVVKLQAMGILNPQSKKIENTINRINYITNEMPHLILASNEDLLNMEFSVSGPLDSDRKHFAYRLVGFNSNWTESKSSLETISISNLIFGTYVLEVKAVDKRFEIEQPITRYKITVLPPFYLTNEALFVYVALIIIVFSIGFYIYLRNVSGAKAHGEKSARNKVVALKDNSDSLQRLLAHKQSLMANISHEIRTPLTLVTEPLKTIVDKLKDEDSKKQFEIVNRNAERVTCLVEQLLEIERLSCIREIPSHSYDINSTATYVVESLKPLAEQKCQHLTLKCNAKGSITLYQDSLQQIFYNLISNAVKYSPDTSEIVVKVWKENDFVMLSVKDQGPGLTQSEARMMFGKFTRLENAEHEKGIGLGLSLVKQLVKANSGFIEVSSEPGKGAEFKVILPAVLKPSSDTETAYEKEKQDDSLKNDSHVYVCEPEFEENQPILLIAEDSEELREFLHNLFKNEFNCYLVKNGKDAINAVSRLMPDLVITDYKMPLKSGIDVAKFIRADEMLTHIPVFIVTGMNDKKSIKTGHDALVDEYILKPFNRDILFKQVKNRIVLNQKMRAAISDSIDNDCGFDFMEGVPKLAREKDQRFYLGLRACFEKYACDPDFNRSKCASNLNVCERQLNRKLEVVVGKSFTETLKAYRVSMAKAKLLEGFTVTDVAYECGFSNPSYFSTVFKTQTGSCPSEFVAKSELMRDA